MQTVSPTGIDGTAISSQFAKAAPQANYRPLPVAQKRSQTEYFAHLQQCPLFQDLASADLELIAENVTSRSMARGESLYKAGDFADLVFLVAKGRVRLTHEADDRKTTLMRFVENGELFGELAVFTESPRAEAAEAAERTTLLQIPRNVFANVIRQNDLVARRLLRSFGRQLTQTESRLKSTLFGSSKDRLLDMLNQIASQHGTKVAAGILIDHKYSHQDLANMIGATRETVTITLGELQTEKRILVDRRRITLLND